MKPQLEVDSCLHILAYSGDSQQRHQARARLAALGEPAIPYLVDALAWEHDVVLDVQQVLLQSADNEAIDQVLKRLTRLLRAQEAGTQTLTHEAQSFTDFCTLLVKRLAAQPRREDFPVFLQLIQTARQTHSAMALLQRPAIVAAHAIVQLAETDPAPELAQALDALKYSTIVPFEFVPLRMRLARRLRRVRALPVPAGPPQDDDHLPIPAVLSENS